MRFLLQIQFLQNFYLRVYSTDKKSNIYSLFFENGAHKSALCSLIINGARTENRQQTVNFALDGGACNIFIGVGFLWVQYGGKRRT